MAGYNPLGPDAPIIFGLSIKSIERSGTASPEARSIANLLARKDEIHAERMEIVGRMSAAELGLPRRP